MVFSVVSPTDFLWFPAEIFCGFSQVFGVFSKWGLAGSYYSVHLQGIVKGDCEDLAGSETSPPTPSP